MLVFRSNQPASLFYGSFQVTLEPGTAVADAPAITQFLVAVAAPAFNGSYGLRVADVAENKTSNTHGNHTGKL